MQKKMKTEKLENFPALLDTIANFLHDANTYVPENKKESLFCAEESIRKMYEHLYAYQLCPTSGSKHTSGDLVGKLNRLK